MGVFIMLNKLISITSLNGHKNSYLHADHGHLYNGLCRHRLLTMMPPARLPSRSSEGALALLGIILMFYFSRFLGKYLKYPWRA
jgi:hypothetical protein